MVWVGHITCVTVRLYSMLATPILMVAWHPLWGGELCLCWKAWVRGYSSDPLTVVTDGTELLMEV